MKIKDAIKVLQARNPEEEMFMNYNNRIEEILTNIEITGKRKSVLLLTLTTPKPSFIEVNDNPSLSCSNTYRPFVLSTGGHYEK